MDILRELNCLLRSLTRRLQVLVDDERHSALEREAARTGRSVGAVVRAALDDHLGLERPHARGAGARLINRGISQLVSADRHLDGITRRRRPSHARVDVSERGAAQ